ncbi:hypothetical protein IKT18_02425 [Candidatus Saccharibacteria bacterium]|nr:hypothetical protein [Candidatus Saccharibacteria bacterium]
MQAFSVMPMSEEIDLQPGEIYQGSIRISNPANATEDLHYSISVSPYSIIDDEYTVDFVTTSNRSQIVDWIEILEPSGIVAPNGVKEVSYTVNVPVDAPSGGQYAMLEVRSDNNNSESSGIAINNVFELASIIYARVAGETRHEGTIISNSIPGFVTNGQPNVSATLTNNGNVHESAQITIKIVNLLTQDVIFPNGDENGVFNEVVMPESTRFATRQLTSLPALGVFEVTQDVSYLGNVENAHNAKVMIMCPLWFLALVILTLGTIIGGIIGTIHRHRKKRMVF